MAPVPFAYVEDIAASWEHYQPIAAAFAGPLPDGLLLHVAGPTDEGFRIIGVWESEAAWGRFRDVHLGGEAGSTGDVPTTIRVLRPAHVVQGATRRAPAPAGGPAPAHGRGGTNELAGRGSAGEQKSEGGHR